MRKGFISKRLRSGRKIVEESIEKKIEIMKAENFEWIDVQNPDRSDIEELAKKYNFNTLNIEDCMTRFELPKLDSYDDHFFVILHFPPLAQKIGISKNSQLSIFVGKNFIVTVHQGDLKPLVQLVDICKTDSEQQSKNRLLGKSSGLLLHEIIDVLVDDLLHTSRKIIANLDELEDRVFDETKPVARSIALLRREINRLRRIVNPLKKFVIEIAKNVKRFSESKDEELTLYFDDVIDHIDKVIETLEESRETMEIYKDTDFVLSTEKTNKVLGLLTIIFTLAIPSTVIGTFYGMNIDLPGGLGESLTFLGPHTMFIFIILASSVPAIMMYTYFRKLGWISN
ncbi:MAG TPA: magnesium transporter CorA family protein [Nitrosopumilus sp.]|jgi:magnesium transporter|nr:magnesium transporter [Nitrososphaerota archaeon]MDP6327148.1 magnesium transporter CorA family protein [Nitrosopumilus sp.]HJL67339.1 magnesium transporter CorA family protein [Nitrosopumilus sp.]HJM25675.1 magnesium transporter CorA family protein [Nitrosopumilus sp.]HJO31320.1 magnesium transporter CorA family protein [Nitrosopumilus sp.]|tara:strand:- start:4263 stop:5285 length:1023 start_codon:yes stop_codon:yes gene_type:complete